MYLTPFVTLLPLVFGYVVLQPRDSETVQRKYIVKFKGENVASITESIMSSIETIFDQKYSRIFRGFTASLTEIQVKKLKSNPKVEFVEQDRTVKINYSPYIRFFKNLPTIKDIKKAYYFHKNKENYKIVQKNAPWGLARLSNNGPHHTRYTYDERAGNGTCVYILDSGVKVDHPEFEGRAKFLRNFSSGSDVDNDGFGTFFAGIIGSSTYGVAKRTILYDVKVLNNGFTTVSTFITAIEYLLNERLNSKQCPLGSVIHISKIFPHSSAFNEAVRKAHFWGFTVVSPAGDDGHELGCDSWDSQGFCTVGAIDKDDKLAIYSNYGQGVRIFAPGTNIKSTWNDGGTRVFTGTAAASSFVAGLSAYYLSAGYFPGNICDRLVLNGKRNVIKAKGLSHYKPGLSIHRISITPNVLANNRLK